MGFDAVSDDATATFKRLYIEPFTKKYPDVDFDVVPQADEGLGQKVQTALAAGAGPDFIETPGSATAIPYAQAGFLADLDALSAQEGWKDKMLPWALDMGVVDKKLVAIPTTYETLVLYYNKTLFEKNGWKIPTDRASLEALAGTMKDAGVTPFTAGNADYNGATEWLVSAFLNQVAGASKIHDALAGKARFTDQEFVDAMKLMVDYFQKGWFGGGVKQYFSTTDPQKFSKLATGKAGMFVSGSWEIQSMNEYFKDSGDDWDWVALPPLADGVSTDVYPLSVGGTISINAASKNIPSAEAYLAWKFSDTEANWNAIKEIGDLPLPVKFDAKDVPDGIDPRFTAQYTAISDASLKQQVGYVTWTSFGGSAEAFILENEDKLLTGDLSAKAFCDAIQKAVEKDRKAGVLPPLFDTDAK